MLPFYYYFSGIEILVILKRQLFTDCTITWKELSAFERNRIAEARLQLFVYIKTARSSAHCCVLPLAALKLTFACVNHPLPLAFQQGRTLLAVAWMPGCCCLGKQQNMSLLNCGEKRSQMTFMYFAQPQSGILVHVPLLDLIKNPVSSFTAYRRGEKVEL